jgi:hypothetical protein
MRAEQTMQWSYGAWPHLGHMGARREILAPQEGQLMSIASPARGADAAGRLAGRSARGRPWGGPPFRGPSSTAASAGWAAPACSSEDLTMPGPGTAISFSSKL